MAKPTTQQYARNGSIYVAAYNAAGILVALRNQTRNEIIPPTTKSFRRLADNNRRNKFRLV